MAKERETPDYLESELRQGAGREMSEEAAEDERLTELFRRRQQGLSVRALELVHRGDRIRAEMGESQFTGLATFGGVDFLTLDTGENLVDIRLDAAVFVVELSQSGGHEQLGGAASLKARLAEVAADGQHVRLLTDDRKNRIGSIILVATDYIELAVDSQTVVVPIQMISALIRPKPRQ
jgi:hypothetical protein